MRKAEIDNLVRALGELLLSEDLGFERDEAVCVRVLGIGSLLSGLVDHSIPDGHPHEVNVH